MRRAKACAKINLGLVAGPLRADDKHEIVTVLQRVDLHDDVELEPADETVVEGFGADTIVAAALAALARAAGVSTGWRVRIEKRIPVAAGLGGGSADAAAALRLANGTLDDPLPPDELHTLAARLGSDVPFLLREGAHVATGDGTELRAVDLPHGYTVVLVVPFGTGKESTGAVYDDFDRRGGARGFAERAAELARTLESIQSASDLGRLPGNDLASSPLADELRAFGAFRADVSGAGPTVYGLFVDGSSAERAEQAMRKWGRTFVTHPC
jgi:4-diphosphocytidyl-2-C-methyl-D-erythritol kinase